MKIFLSALLFIPISLFSEVIRLDGVDFHYRIPQKFNEKSKIMVLFDGIVRQGFGFYNPNHAAALICAIFPFCWDGENMPGWGGY